MPTLDGQDDALNELILARQWKQALNLCEKKLKKANNSDYLLVCDPPSSLTKDFGGLHAQINAGQKDQFTASMARRDT